MLTDGRRRRRITIASRDRWRPIQPASARPSGVGNLDETRERDTGQRHPARPRYDHHQTLRQIAAAVAAVYIALQQNASRGRDLHRPRSTMIYGRPVPARRVGAVSDVQSLLADQFILQDSSRLLCRLSPLHTALLSAAAALPSSWHSTTPTPTSSRGSSRECRRVVQLAA